MAEQPFAGFRGGQPATVIPNTFFTVLLPAIERASEWVVCCYIFFALGQRRGVPRTVSRRELVRERPLMQALARLPGGAEPALDEGLALAVGRGTLLVATTDAGDASYALNTEMARRRFGNLDQTGGIGADAEDQIEGQQARPNIYVLYEENIGSLPPLLIDELDEAEKRFPPAWIEAAFREAVVNNRRNWRYIVRILERWQLEGPSYETPGRPSSYVPAAQRRTIGGPYRRVVDRPRRDGG